MHYRLAWQAAQARRRRGKGSQVRRNGFRATVFTKRRGTILARDRGLERREQEKAVSCRFWAFVTGFTHGEAVLGGWEGRKGRIVPPKMGENGRVFKHFLAFLGENWLKKKRPGPVIGPGLWYVRTLPAYSGPPPHPPGRQSAATGPGGFPGETVHPPSPDFIEEGIDGRDERERRRSTKHPHPRQTSDGCALTASYNFLSASSTKPPA